MTKFDKAFEILIGHEGGLSLDPKDRGNWTGGQPGVGILKGTKYGISAMSYPSLDIARLTIEQAKAIYKRDFWDKVRGDDMPGPLSLLAFDGAVHSGVKTSSEWIQQAAGATPDGAIGPRTLEAVRKRPLRAMVVEATARRMVHLASLPTWGHHGLGWARRIAALPFQALEMPE